MSTSWEESKTSWEEVLLWFFAKLSATDCLGWRPGCDTDRDSNSEVNIVVELFADCVLDCCVDRESGREVNWGVDFWPDSDCKIGDRDPVEPDLELLDLLDVSEDTEFVEVLCLEMLSVVSFDDLEVDGLTSDFDCFFDEWCLLASRLRWSSRSDMMSR